MSSADRDVEKLAGTNSGKQPQKVIHSFLRAVLIPAVLLFVILAVFLINNSLSTERAIDRAEQVLRESAEEQAATLDAIIDGQYVILEVFAASIATQDTIEADNVVVRMAAIVNNSSFLHLFYTLPDGTSYVDNGMVLDVAERAYFQQALTGRRSIERLSASLVEEDPRFVLAVPIIKGEQIVGVIHGSYTEKMLRNMIISKAYGGEAYSTICNSDGDFLTGTDNPNFMLTQDNIFASLADVNIDEGYSLEKIKADIAGGVSGMYSYEINGNKRYVVYMPLNIVSASGRQWYIFNVVPGSVVAAEVAQMTESSVLFYFIIMLASVVTLLFIILRERKNAKKLKADSEELRISEEQFRIAAAQGGRIVARYDIKTSTYYNEQETLFAKDMGREITNVPQVFIEAGIIEPGSVVETLSYFARIKQGEKYSCAVLELQVADQQYRWFKSEATVVFDAQDQPSLAIMVFYDITEQREKETIYKKWQQSLQEKPAESYTLFRCNLNKDATSDFVEGSLLKIEFSPGNLTFNARTREYAEQYVYPDDRSSYTALLNSDTLLANYYRGQRTAVLDFREILSDGEIRWLRLSVDLVEYPNSTEVEAYLMYENINEIKQAELLAKERAETDPLTGVLNRTAFAAAIDRMINETGIGSQHALFMLDIDGFKLLNDSFGHAAGDQALLDIVKILRSVLRHGDLLGRLGGDEFMLCFKDITYDAAIEKKARQICDLLHKSFSLDVQISASIGIVVYPRDGDSFDTLYRHADAALYHVKGSGKDNFAFFNSQLTGEQQTAEELTDPVGPTGLPGGKRRMLIVDDSIINRKLLTKIFEDEFIVDTASDGRTALIRMRHYGSSIAVVLLDLVMPGMDGFAVLQKMRSSVELQSIPVIVVSGASELETSLKTIQHGASDFVTKPVDPALIRLRVHSAISKAENERLRAQNSYLQLQSGEEARYRTVLESTGTVVIQFDWLNGVFSYDPSISEHIAGNFDSRKLWRILLSDMIADVMDVKEMQELVHDIANDRVRKSGSMKVLLKIPAGEKHWFRMNIFKQTDEYQLTDKMLLTFNDINEEVLADEKLRFQAERDNLTALYNRRTFLGKAEKVVSKKPANAYIMAVGDIDNFKIVNDMFGHAEGDKLLQYAAEELLRRIEKVNGLCGRLHNDVFAALLPYDQAIVEVLNRFSQELLAHYSLKLELTCSIGYYIIEDPNMSADGMLDRASLAKQTVKGRYDVKVAWYDEKMREKLLIEQEIIGSMEAALTQGQFDIHLQPQYDHTTGCVAGAEALVRWLHPEKGMIYPGEFIPIFEKNGFITKLDEYVWNRTAELLGKWLAGGHQAVPVSVNVSRLDTNDPLLCEKLLSIVKRHSIPIELFRLEITEGLFVQDSERLINVVDKLHQNGFLIEMDDFGSGYSSLNILKDVPVDVLKLDMRFFSNSGDQDRGGIILNAVMHMAQNLNIPVIAEGVETAEQADYLSGIGCQIIQGYLYAKPMPVADFEELMLHSSINDPGCKSTGKY